MKVKTFQNNLRLVVNTKKDVDVVSFKVFVTVGAKDETKEEYGYAHFLEHMFFKSSKNNSSENLLKKLDDLGASKNAYTSISKTCYYFKCISSVFEQCLKIYSEMFFNQMFNVDEIEKEKNVILEEYKMGEDDPTNKCIKMAYNSMFAGTNLGHDVIGTPETINGVTASKLLAFKKRNYLPHNIVISVSGNISFENAEKLVQEYFVNNFEELSTKKTYEPLKYVELAFDDKYLVTKKDNKQAEVYIMIDLKEKTRKQKIAFNLFFAILTHGMSSKFFEIIRGKQGLVYTIEGGCSKVCNNFLADILFATSPSNVKKALASVREIISSCAKGNITEEELTRTKNQFISGLVFSSESNSVIAENNARDIIEYGKVISEKQVTKEYMAVTLEDIISCAKEVNGTKDYIISVVGSVPKNDLKVF